MTALSQAPYRSASYATVLDEPRVWFEGMKTCCAVDTCASVSLLREAGESPSFCSESEGDVSLFDELVEFLRKSIVPFEAEALRDLLSEGLCAFISDAIKKAGVTTDRYSDPELEEFRPVVTKKLEAAKQELLELEASSQKLTEDPKDLTHPDNISDRQALYGYGIRAQEVKKLIGLYENSLKRIDNKTYGVCKTTKRLIPKGRLRSHPAATELLEVKQAREN